MRAEQIQQYIDLLLEVDKAAPSSEMHDRIERALSELERARDEPRMVPYDIPLRPTVMVRVTLPMDFTDNEAERLSRVLRSIAFSKDRP